MAKNKVVPITRVNKFFSLYGLYCPINDELRYIGITTKSLNHRLNRHLRKPTNYKIGMWFKELMKQGLKPIIKLIKEFDSYSSLLSGEINEIKIGRENGLNLFNMADGGDINYMLGRTHTPEARLKISIANKGRIVSEDELANRKVVMDKLWSDEVWSRPIKNKMSKNMIGNKIALGYKHTDETKELISIRNLGNKYALGNEHTDETKELMSIRNSGEGNPFYSKKHSLECMLLRSDKVITNGTYKGENNPNFKYNINYDDLYRLFITDNKTIEEIAEIYGCCINTINKNLRDYKIKKPLSNKYNLIFDEIINYKESGLNLVEIGKIYGCSNKRIHKFIKKQLINYEKK